MYGSPFRRRLVELLKVYLKVFEGKLIIANELFISQAKGEETARIEERLLVFPMRKEDSGKNTQFFTAVFLENA